MLQLPASPVASGLFLLSFWLLYGLASATVLYVLRAKSTFSAVLAATIAFTVIDCLLPFSFTCPKHSLIVAEILFCFGIVRPAKMILFAFNRGPLGRDLSLRQHLILASLPVIPLKCLPKSAQKRMKIYKNSVARALEIVASIVVLLLSCAVRCSLDEEEMPTLAGYATQIVSFIAFMNQLLNLPAAIATALGSEAIVTPFNEFWKAASVAEWWNFRWNNVVSLTLRLSVYQPIVDAFKAKNPDQRSTAVVALAGIATFAASGGIHVYAMVAQRFPHATMPLMSFFLLQALLIAIQPYVSRAVLQLLAVFGGAEVDKGRQHAVDRAITAAMLWSTVLLLWCRAYEPPYSHATYDLAQALLRAAGLCDAIKHCHSL